MKRRALIAATSMAALGQAVQGLGELTELALPTGEALPSRLDMVHVHTVEAVTQRLRSVGRQFGGQADLFGAAVAHHPTNRSDASLRGASDGCSIQEQITAYTAYRRRILTFR